MKRICIFWGMILWSLQICAQHADEKIGGWINQQDWFTLEKEYPRVKDSVQTGFLKWMAEIMIDQNFNRPDQAISGISRLLKDHQQEIGTSTVLSMVQLATIIDGENGNYGTAADGIKNLIEVLKASGMKQGLEPYEELYLRYNNLRSYPKPSVSRPERDVIVPIEVDEVRGGTLLYVPVGIHGKTYRFIFDTGAAKSLISEQFAKEMGVRIIEDPLNIHEDSSDTSVPGKGFLDKMQIGDITFENVLVLIKSPDEKVDRVFQVDAVLGMDFMKLVKEFQIYPADKKIVFPVKTTSLPATGRNLLLTLENKPILKTNSDNNRLLFFFDTGNSTADLFYSYYTKYKNEIDPVATKDTITGGGFGFIRTKEVLIIPSLSFKVGDTFVTMKDIRVHPAFDSHQTREDGNIGMDLIKLFSKTTINLTDMFVEFE